MVTGGDGAVEVGGTGRFAGGRERSGAPVADEDAIVETTLDDADIQEGEVSCEGEGKCWLWLGDFVSRRHDRQKLRAKAQREFGWV